MSFSHSGPADTVLADEGVLRAFPGCRVGKSPTLAWRCSQTRRDFAHAVGGPIEPRGQIALSAARLAKPVNAIAHLRAAIRHIELQQSVGVAVRDLGQILRR
jgi:hypothetical protein